MVQDLKAGVTIALPADKVQRLLNAGYAESITPDIEEYRRLTLELSERDPKGGCWDWIIQHRPEMWQGHMKAYMGGDIPGAREAFDECVSAWNEQRPSNSDI
jgi:hypothetical protein